MLIVPIFKKTFTYFKETYHHITGQTKMLVLLIRV